MLRRLVPKERCLTRHPGTLYSVDFYGSEKSKELFTLVAAVQLGIPNEAISILRGEDRQTFEFTDAARFARLPTNDEGTGGNGKHPATAQWHSTRFAIF